MNAIWASWRSKHGDAVGIGGFADRLEEGRATGPAIAAAAGRDSQRLGPVIERAARVAWLGTDIGLNQATDGAMETTAVTNRDVQRGDGARVRTGGGPCALDRFADEGVRDGEPTWVGPMSVVCPALAYQVVTSFPQCPAVRK
jgi:hypothetical protein